jgi:transcriptional regulator of acetoin/glycerol metabolism
MRRIDRPGERSLESLRAAREHFLNSGTLLADVRAPISDSWSRCSQLGVDSFELGAPSTAGDLKESEIPGSVFNVLRHTADALADEPVSIIFAGPEGQILSRHCTDGRLSKKLESVFLAPGFGYGESAVGTNGIGTTIEGANPTLVVGSEHFNEKLSVFACAGAPVRHPTSGAILGVLDLTCEAPLVTPLLLTTAKSIAAQVQDALTELVGARELALLREYMAASRRSAGPVLALNRDVVMMNRHAQAVLAPEDRAALLAHTSDLVNERNPRTLVADLPSGTVARMQYRPTVHGAAVIGGIISVQVDIVGRETLQRSTASPPARRPAGLVGDSVEWTRAVDQVQEHLMHGRSLILEGERGVGKLAMIEALHRSAGNAGPLRVFDCAAADEDPDWLDEVARELAEPSGALVLRHLELLPIIAMGALSELLVQRPSGSRAGNASWLVATRTLTEVPPDFDSVIAPCFDITLRIPPLRHRPQDIGPIATSFLRRLAHNADISFTPAALRQLARLPWDGNLTQLRSVVNKIVRTKRAGIVDIGELPPECQSTVRRSLTHLESLERDAIVEALRACRDNKKAAAEHLGMSRATIYRKIREYGIATSPVRETAR